MADRTSAAVQDAWTQVDTWLELGKRNPWIRNAWDPPFNRRSFFDCVTIVGLASKVSSRNWCLGQAFFLRDLCFIQQVNGGDEWLTIRHDVAFESISLGYILEYRGWEAYVTLIEDLLAATKDECTSLTYRDARLRRGPNHHRRQP